MSQINSQTHTELHRYPLLFGNMHLLRRRLMGKKVRILSFGCSSGEEMASLALYFPEDEIVGCDIDAAALAKAREVARTLPNATVFRSDRAGLERHGPYDLIFANSVLCINTANEKRVAEGFPFSRFEEMVSMLADVLSDRGVLALYNTSYFPADSDALLDRVRPIRSHFVTPGYVPMFDRDCRLELARRVESRRGFYERVASGTRNFSDYFDILYTRSPDIASFRLDYSNLPSFKGGEIFPQCPTGSTSSGRLPILQKTLMHHRPDLDTAGIWSMQNHFYKQRLAIGEEFLFQMFYKVPGSPSGFISTSDY